MGYKVNNGVDTGGFPMYLIRPLIEYCQIDMMVECGTAGGLSIREAAKYFKKCHTIELIEGRAEVDKTIKNVKWHTGNSIDILPQIIAPLVRLKRCRERKNNGKAVYKYAIFWLDSHWSEPYPNNTEYKECYILEELEAIAPYQDSAIILIDDARLFMGQPPAPNNPKDWPSIQDIFVLLKNKFPHNYSTIVDDYILSVPERLREPVDAEWRSRYLIRYPTESDKLRTETKNVYEALKKYIDVT